MDWNVHSLSSRLKVAQCSSLNYKVTVINIFGLSVVLKIIIDHLIRYIARTPAPISYCPKMPAPIPLFQLRKFLLKLSWTTPFQLLYQTAYAWGGPILQISKVRQRIWMSPFKTAYRYFVHQTICTLSRETVCPLLRCSVIPVKVRIFRS